MAEISIIVTDMGNGGAYCSECHYDLDRGDPRNTIPNICPGCGEEFTGRTGPSNFGGSDF